MMKKDESIYLIGSYHKFRDKIINRLPGKKFSDPRTHRQASTAKLVYDDLEKAEKCPIALSVFPKGKSRGTMSYVEIGVSYSNGNFLITDDEGEKDSVLEEISNVYLDSLEAAIEYIRTMPENKKTRKEVQSKYPTGFMGEIPLKRILLCGTKTSKLEKTAKEVMEKTQKEVIFNEDTAKEIARIDQYDLVVANFPKDQDWDRAACLLMGGAYAHDISVLIMDEHEWKYPPLQAVARRHGTEDNLAEYLLEVEDLNIASEAVNMYHFFKRESKKHN